MPSDSQNTDNLPPLQEETISALEVLNILYLTPTLWTEERRNGVRKILEEYETKRSDDSASGNPGRIEELMREFEEQGGISFLILSFTAAGEMYYLPFSRLSFFWERMQKGGRKSFTYEEIDRAFCIRSHRDILVHYLEPLSRDLQLREEPDPGKE